MVKHNLTSNERNRFIRAFFTCFEPFAVMMAEISAIMERCGAKQGYHSLAINYNFSDKDEVIEFSLSHFRDFCSSYHKLYECAVLRIWSSQDIFSFCNDLKDLSAELQRRIRMFVNIDSLDNWSPGENIPETWRADEELYAIANLLHDLYYLAESIDDQSIDEDSKESHILNVRLNDFFNGLNLVTRPVDKGIMADIKGSLYKSYEEVNKIAWLRRISSDSTISKEHTHSKPNELSVILQHYKDLPTVEYIKECIALSGMGRFVCLG